MPAANHETDEVASTGETRDELPSFTVQFHRKRILLLATLIVGICVIAMPYWMWRDYQDGKRTDRQALQIGIGSALIGLAVFVITCRKPLKGEPAFIVDDAGIVDNIGPFHGPRRISWSDISSIGLHHVGHWSYLRIRLHDEGRYLRRKGLVQRISMQLVKLTNRGAPFMVSETPLAAPISRIFEEIQLRRAIVTYRAEAADS